MKIIHNKLIPFGKYYAINLFGFVFTKRQLKDWELRHEEIHSEQMKEMLYLLFYLWYVLEFLVKLPFCKFSLQKAYKSISFEQEAYNYQMCDNRNKYNWLKYVLSLHN